MLVLALCVVYFVEAIRASVANQKRVKMTQYVGAERRLKSKKRNTDWTMQYETNTSTCGHQLEGSKLNLPQEIINKMSGPLPCLSPLGYLAEKLFVGVPE